MTEGLLCLRLATLLFWLGVVLTGVRADYINLQFPTFKNEATKERATYCEGDMLLVAWSATVRLQELHLYCTKSDGLSWGDDHSYGSGERLSADWTRGLDIGNAQNMNLSSSRDQEGGSGTQIYQLRHLPSYNWRETVECAFAAFGMGGPETFIGFGYPFKFYNYVREKAIPTPFGPDGPIDADDISNEPSSTISTQMTSATGISATGSPQNKPTATSPPLATESADGPAPIATSTSSGTVLPTGPATGIEPGTAESPGAKKNRGGLSNGATAGIGAGAAVGVITIAALAFLLFWRRRKSRLTAAAAATASASTADSTSPGGGGGETQEKGAMTTYFKAELEDNQKPYGNELDGTGKEAEMKEKTQVSELGVVERRHEVDGGGWQNRFELA